MFYVGLFSVTYNLSNYFLSEFYPKKDKDSKEKPDLIIMDKYYSPTDDNLDLIFKNDQIKNVFFSANKAWFISHLPEIMKDNEPFNEVDLFLRSIYEEIINELKKE